MNLAPTEILNQVSQNVSLQWIYNEDLEIYILIQNYSLEELLKFENVKYLKKRYETTFMCFDRYIRIIIEKIKVNEKIYYIGFFSTLTSVSFEVNDRKKDKFTSHFHFAHKRLLIEKEQTCRLLLNESNITHFKKAIARKDTYSISNAFTNLYRGYGCYPLASSKLLEMKLESIIEVRDFKEEFLKIFSILHFNTKSSPEYLPSPIIINDDQFLSFKSHFIDGFSLKSKEQKEEIYDFHNTYQIFQMDHSIAIQTSDPQIDLKQLFVPLSPLYNDTPRGFNILFSNLSNTSLILSFRFIELNIILRLNPCCFGERCIMRAAIPNDFKLCIQPENANYHMNSIDIWNDYRNDREQLLYLIYYLKEFVLKTTK
ncbi:MAG: hypothetical protein Q4D02_02350 [Clostridia bacterium]|nr:hypothetical protein [Clostridia bacterium]